MDDISRYKSEVRVLQRQLRVLLNEWDPISVDPPAWNSSYLLSTVTV